MPRPYQDLKPGSRYLVRWKQQSGNYQWYEHEAIWTYIGKQETYNNVVLIWSGRPACGTQDMDAKMYLDAAEMPKEGKNTLPKRVGKYVG